MTAVVVRLIVALVALAAQTFGTLVGNIMHEVIAMNIACALTAIAFPLMVLDTALPILGFAPIIEHKLEVGSCQHRGLVVAQYCSSDVQGTKDWECWTCKQSCSVFQIPRGSCFATKFAMQGTDDPWNTTGTSTKNGLETKYQPSLKTVEVTAQCASPTEAQT